MSASVRITTCAFVVTSESQQVGYDMPAGMYEGGTIVQVPDTTARLIVAAGAGELVTTDTAPAVAEPEADA